MGDVVGERHVNGLRQRAGWRRPAALVAAVAVVITAGTATGWAHASAAPASVDRVTRLVDDDRAQCPEAGYTTIRSAIADSSDGDKVKVCAGLYPEGVLVDKRLDIEGESTESGPWDCFAPELPVDPARHPVVQAVDGMPSDALLTIEHDGVEVEGLVLRGATGTSGSTVRPAAAINTSSVYSDLRLHRNLITGNRIGVHLRSSGPARFDHNCLRANSWGVANEFAPLVDAVIDANDTYLHLEYTFELTSGAEGVELRGNASRGDRNPYMADSTVGTVIAGNVVDGAQRGMRIFGGNTDLLITGNRITSSNLVGIAIASFRNLGVPAESNVGSVVSENSIRGSFGNPGAGIGLADGGLKHGVVSHNVVENNVEGIVLRQGNTGNAVVANMALTNRLDGIRAAAGATGNVVTDNVADGNGWFSTATAYDLSDLAFTTNGNTWARNVCDRDNPAGALCGT